jgi:hypothetical protein
MQLEEQSKRTLMEARLEPDAVTPEQRQLLKVRFEQQRVEQEWRSKHGLGPSGHCQPPYA